MSELLPDGRHDASFGQEQPGNEIQGIQNLNRATNSNRLLLIIAYVGFISLGLPDTVVGVAWPSVRETFGLNQGAISLVFIGTGIGYFVSSFSTGRLLTLFNVGSLLAASSVCVALSGFGFGFAPIWILFAACSLLHGLGSGAIDAGLNYYVAHHFSARHMNWLHSFYSVGAMLGPLIMTGAIAWNNSWRAGYVCVASILALLSILFAVTRRRWDDSNAPANPEENAPKATVSETLRQPVVWFHIVLFFIYTGLEVSVGQWSFTVLTESRGIPKEAAGIQVTAFWASILAGRVLCGFIADSLGVDRLLRLSMAVSLTGTVLFAMNLSRGISAFALCLTGLGLAAIYPCLMTQTPGRIGKRWAPHAIGFQVSAGMIGAAILPSSLGLASQGLGLETIGTGAVVMAAALAVLHEVILFRLRA